MPATSMPDGKEAAGGGVDDVDEQPANRLRAATTTVVVQSFTSGSIPYETSRIQGISPKDDAVWAHWTRRRDKRQRDGMNLSAARATADLTSQHDRVRRMHGGD